MSMSVAVHSTVHGGLVCGHGEAAHERQHFICTSLGRASNIHCRYRCYRRRLKTCSDHRRCKPPLKRSTAISYMQWVESRGALPYISRMDATATDALLLERLACRFSIVCIMQVQCVSS